MEIPKPDWWDQWTYYDKDTHRTLLKDDAPEDVRKKWDQLQNPGDDGLVDEMVDGTI